MSPLENLCAFVGEADLVATTVDGVSTALYQPALLEDVDERHHRRAVDAQTLRQALLKGGPLRFHDRQDGEPAPVEVERLERRKLDRLIGDIRVFEEEAKPLGQRFGRAVLGRVGIVLGCLRSRHVSQYRATLIISYTDDQLTNIPLEETRDPDYRRPGVHRLAHHPRPA